MIDEEYSDIMNLIKDIKEININENINKSALNNFIELDTFNDNTCNQKYLDNINNTNYKITLIKPTDRFINTINEHIITLIMSCISLNDDEVYSNKTNIKYLLEYYNLASNLDIEKYKIIDADEIRSFFDQMINTIDFNNTNSTYQNLNSLSKIFMYKIKKLISYLNKYYFYEGTDLTTIKDDLNGQKLKITLLNIMYMIFYVITNDPI